MESKYNHPFFLFTNFDFIFNRYYECTIDDVLDDGTCTIVFDGFESAPVTVVRVSVE